MTEPGLGILSGFLIEDRSETERLAIAVSANAKLVGINVDPDTALVIRGKEARVIGEKTVTIQSAKKGNTEATTRTLKPGATLDLLELRGETQKKENLKSESKLTAETVRGLELRGLGPALKPGRVGDIAIDPFSDSTWYVVVASGGLWKTTDRVVLDVDLRRMVLFVGCVTPIETATSLARHRRESVAAASVTTRARTAAKRRHIGQEFRAHRQDCHRPANSDVVYRSFNWPAAIAPKVPTA